MVHNRENFASINYLAYYKMDQKSNLQSDYDKEYHYYMQALERCAVARAEARRVDHNNKLFDHACLEQDTIYPKLPSGVTGYIHTIPRIPSEPDYMEHPDEVDLYKYYNVEKFTTGWMLNVSPAWKGVPIDQYMIDFFIAVIEKFYDNCGRFTKMKYVLENGHGADHLHAHIVFTLNTKKPGYMTPIKKGRILTEFRNCWNRLAKDTDTLDHLMIDGEEYYLDVEGLVNARCALNTCLLTKDYMLKDKLDYLCEDLKPESHKNDSHPLCPIKGSKGYD